MPRLTNLDDVLFPVEEHPVFVDYADNKGERRLPVPGKKAIVARHNQRVLGIVGQSYRLVSNREALDMARECCQTVFPKTKPGEWEVKTADAPATGSYCHIDLVHNSAALDFKFVPASQRPEVFGPFIRVTNSYNGLRALSFDIGFFRKVCKNGLIMPGSIIRFAFTHDQKAIGETICFDVAHDRLAQFQNSFDTYLGKLRDFKIPRGEFESLILGVLRLHKPEPLKSDTREADDWRLLTGSLSEMSDRYISELGENSYAAFNAITEFASHPPENRCVHRDRHSLQRLVGLWLSSFSAECHKPEFTIKSHLEQLANQPAESRTFLN